MGCENRKGKEYQPYLDMIRIISAFMVVLAHVSAQEWENISVSSAKWQVLNIYDCLAVPSVPLFFMISGALLLNQDYQISLKKLYLNKCLHLFVVYHVWMLFYNLLPFFRGELAWTYENIKFDLIFDVLEGKGIYHLWFIPQLLIMYMMTPVLKEAFRKKEICQYFLVLFFIIGTLLPAILLYDFPYKRFVSSYYSRLSSVMLTGYIGYYVLGHYLHSFVLLQLSRKKKSALAIIGVLSYGVTIVACSLDALQKNKPSVILNTPFAAPHFLSTICIFILIRSCSKKVNTNKYWMIKLLSKLSFGVYLLHPFVIDIVKRIGISTIEPHPIFMVPVFAGMVFGISAFITFLLQKIPVIKKMVS